MTWRKVENAAPVVPGRKYRSTWYLKAPYSKKLADLIVHTTWTLRAAALAAGITVDRVLAISPAATVQTPGARYMRWRIEVFWHRKAG